MSFRVESIDETKNLQTVIFANLIYIHIVKTEDTECKTQDVKRET